MAAAALWLGVAWAASGTAERPAEPLDVAPVVDGDPLAPSAPATEPPAPSATPSESPRPVPAPPPVDVDDDPDDDDPDDDVDDPDDD